MVDGGLLLGLGFGGSWIVVVDAGGGCGFDAPLFMEIAEAFVIHAKYHCSWTAVPGTNSSRHNDFTTLRFVLIG